MIKKIIKVCIFIIIVISISLFALYYEQKIPVLGYHFIVGKILNAIFLESL